MERTREMSEAEREKLLDLVQTLELKLNSIEQVTQKKFVSFPKKIFFFGFFGGKVERKIFTL